MGKENELTGKNLAMSRCREIVTLEMSIRIHTKPALYDIKLSSVLSFNMSKCGASE
jgi:hypothetical protein